MGRKSYLEQALTAVTGRDLPEYLRELYVDRRFTDQDIAGVLGVSRGSVNDLRRKYGIRRADRAPVTL